MVSSSRSPDGAPHSVEHILTDPVFSGMRVDRFISEGLGLFSRSQVRSRVVGVQVNDRESRPAKRLRLGDRLRVFYTEPAPSDVVPERLHLDILFENNDVIVIDKPSGMVVHPAKGNYRGTVVNAVLAHCEELGDAFGAGGDRPGIVHRLDKDTSGVLIVAKRPEVHEFLSHQFKSRTVRKHYIAVVKGSPSRSEGRIDRPLARSRRNRKKFSCVSEGGKHAVTDYAVLKRYPGYSLLKLMPRTGRTHQIRVHVARLGCPILGDALYARRDSSFPETPLMLHAYRLSIQLPGEEEHTTFRAPVPTRFKKVLRALS